MDELEAVKDNFKGTVLLSADSVESRMSSIAKNEIFSASTGRSVAQKLRGRGFRQG